MLLLLGVGLMMAALLAWALLRDRGGGARRDDLIDPQRALFEQARSQGHDEAAARRIAARGGDDRYEMPGRSRPAPAPVAAPDGGLVEVTEELRAEVRALLHAGHMVGAVKLVRERTGLGLRESKDLVEAMRRDDVTLR